MKKVPLQLAALVLATTPALAASPRDARLVQHRYNPDEVVRVDGQLGVQASIAFADDEMIENVAVGDSNAWQITPNKRANILFVKPLATRARTNMTVVTSEHAYYFDLVSTPNGRPLYVLRFTYPEKPKPVQVASIANPAGGALTTAESQAIATAPAEATTDPAKLNFAWRQKGKANILPSRIYDDGQSTFVSWAPGVLLPAIQIRDDKGAEGPVNYAVRGDVIVIEGVPDVIVLRAGKNFATLEHQAKRPTGAALATASQAAPPLPNEKGDK